MMYSCAIQEGFLFNLFQTLGLPPLLGLMILVWIIGWLGGFLTYALMTRD